MGLSNRLSTHRPTRDTPLPPHEARRLAWNARMIQMRRRLGLPTVNLDWDQAIRLFKTGTTPEQAARRIRVAD